MKKFLALLFILTMVFSSCLKEHNDIIPILEGEPAGGLLDINIDAIDSNEILLTLDLFAVDHLGGFVNNLKKENFSIVQNLGDNINAEVIEVIQSGEELRGAYSATLLFDQSGSIGSTDPGNSRVDAGVKFANIISGGDEASVAAFTSGGNYQDPYEVLSNFNNDPAILIPHIEALANNHGGGTPLYKSIDGLIPFTSDNGKNINKAIIAFTDGQDTDSGVTLDEIIENACIHNMRVYTVGLGSSLDYGDLYELAFETDGAVMLADNAVQLISLYSSLGELLHGESRSFNIRIKLTKTSGEWQLGEIINRLLKLKLNDAFEVNFRIFKRINERDTRPFYEKIPPCPCRYDNILLGQINICDEGEWFKCGPLTHSKDFHHGASFEARWKPKSRFAPGQQCTYDENMDLITEGIAAGTPDKNSPGGCESLDIFHLTQDVIPWKYKSCEDYLLEWPPSHPNSCASNTVSGFYHMPLMVKDFTCAEITDLLKIAEDPSMAKELSDYIFDISTSTPANLKDLLNDFLNTTYCQTNSCTVIEMAIKNLE